MIAGVILAGGRATRMGGGDKGLLDLGGRPILAHVIDRLAPQVDRLALNAAGDPARFAAFGLPVLPDSVSGFAGPLAGVLAGLDWAAGQGADAIVTAAADTPFFPRDLVAVLRAAAAAEGTPLAMATTPGEGGADRHPTFGLWPVSLRDDLRAALAAGLRKIVAWTEPHGCARAAFPDARRLLQRQHPRRSRPRPCLRGSRRRMKLYGVTGWKNSGKTVLVERLVAELTARGLAVSTLKHAHHGFDVDQPGKDSHRHRAAGAAQVLVASARRWALMTELRGAPEPPLEALLARLDPVDLVLVEGFKRDRHPKIETRRAATAQDLIAAGDATVEAIASDTPLPDAAVPVFDLDAVPTIADFILARTGLA